MTTADETGAGRQFSVLVVCTGNICRSPAAELLLQAGPGADPGVRVASAGTAAVVGAPVAAPMAALLSGHGVDPGGWTARQLDPAAVRSVDLVLTMTTEQRSAVVSRVPAAVRRTFTLREFADLARLLADQLDGDGAAERLAALVRAAPRARGRRIAEAAQDDIEDPYGRGGEVFVRVLAQIGAAVTTLVDAVARVSSHAP